VALSLADFNGMVADHGPAMYRLAYRLVGDRHEAEDIVQDTFRSAWKSRNLFKPQLDFNRQAASDAEFVADSRPSGVGRAWLASILRRRVFDRYRQHRLPTLLADEQNLETELPPEDPFRDELTDEMQNALGRLPAELKETLILVVVAELTHQQAAEMLGVPLGTVLSRVSRARTRLLEFLTPPPSKEGSEFRVRGSGSSEQGAGSRE
jgi:RNA polymerase sigma-70 factor, ECF subfamily